MEEVRPIKNLSDNEKVLIIRLVLLYGMIGHENFSLDHLLQVMRGNNALFNRAADHPFIWQEIATQQGLAREGVEIGDPRTYILNALLDDFLRRNSYTPLLDDCNASSCLLTSTIVSGAIAQLTELTLVVSSMQPQCQNTCITNVLFPCCAGHECTAMTAAGHCMIPVASFLGVTAVGLLFCGAEKIYQSRVNRELERHPTVVYLRQQTARQHRFFPVVMEDGEPNDANTIELPQAVLMDDDTDEAIPLDPLMRLQ